MTEKEELIVGEINMGRGPINLVPINAETIRICESLINTGIVPIPKSHINTGTAHVHAIMPIEV